MERMLIWGGNDKKTGCVGVMIAEKHVDNINQYLRSTSKSTCFRERHIYRHICNNILQATVISVVPVNDVLFIWGD